MVEDVLVLDYGDPRSLDDPGRSGRPAGGRVRGAVQSRHPDLQPREFLHELRDVTRRRGIALIFDEVVTGFRLHPRGAQGFYGIDADIASYGKLIGGGMPIAVMAGKAAYLDAFDGGALAVRGRLLPGVRASRSSGAPSSSTRWPSRPPPPSSTTWRQPGQGCKRS